MIGRLELIVGTMRSSKSGELLRRVEIRRQYAKQQVLVLKPNDDTKAAAGVIQSRNTSGCSQMEAVEFPSSNPWVTLEIISRHEKLIGRKLDSVAIDEFQFVRDGFLWVKRMLEAGYDVLACGLDLDFRGLPFGDTLALSWLVRQTGGDLTEMVAYCHCGAKALYPQRLIIGVPAPYDSPVIQAGDEGYQPVCQEHFVLPGSPH